MLFYYFYADNSISHSFFFKKLSLLSIEDFGWEPLFRLNWKKINKSEKKNQFKKVKIGAELKKKVLNQNQDLRYWRQIENCESHWILDSVFSFLYAILYIHIYLIATGTFT